MSWGRERTVIETLLRQGAVIPCGLPRCKDLIRMEHLEDVERDHNVPRGLGGADTPENCSYMHGRCHAMKTDGEAHARVDGDKSKIAKAKRLAKGPRERKGKAIQSRPFDKGRGWS